MIIVMANTSHSVSRVLWLLAAAAFFLAPWTMWLSHSLPPTHLARRWGIAWGGLDVGECVTLVLTAYLGLRKSGWVIIAGSIAGTLLLVDAWFDCVTAAVGREYLFSLLAAACAELPLSFLAFWVAYKASKEIF